MAVWTRGRHTPQKWWVVCPAKFVIACALLLARLCSQGSHAALRAFDLEDCTIEVSNSSRTEVHCSTTFLRDVDDAQGKQVLATFAFMVDSELASILQCRSGAGRNVTDVSQNRTHCCWPGRTTNCIVVGGTTTHVKGNHCYGAVNAINCTVTDCNASQVFPNEASCCRNIDASNCAIVDGNTTRAFENATRCCRKADVFNCTVIGGNKTYLSHNETYYCRIVKAINCSAVDRNMTLVSLDGAPYCKNIEAISCTVVGENVTDNLPNRAFCCEDVGVISYNIVCSNETHVSLYSACSFTEADVINCTVISGSVSIFSRHDFRFCRDVMTKNGIIVCSNVTRVSSDAVRFCDALEVMDCTVIGEARTCEPGQAKTRDCKSEFNDKTCEYKRRFGIRLVSAKLEPVFNKEVSVNELTTPPKLAAFLGQLENVDISFSPNCSTESFFKCSATGVLEMRSQCNLTTWNSDCDLKVSLNASNVAAGYGSSTTYGWNGAVADLRLHGTVESLHISGNKHAMVRATEALRALCVMGARTISLSYVHITDCSFPGVNLTGLRYLNISHSQLPPNNCSFSNINAPDLRALILRNVSLTSVPRNLSMLVNLTILDLSMNQHIVSNDIDSFKKEIVTWTRLRKLSSLFLSEVHLGSLSVLRNLLFEPDGKNCTPISGMSELKLSDCRIQDLEDETFYRCLSSLAVLDLSYNQILEMPSRIFSQLKIIKYLQLSHNNIKVLPIMEFYNDSSLEIFNLSYNGISSLSNFMASGSTKTLDISHNKIVEWHTEEMFCKSGTYLTWVKHLNIAYNSLKTVNRVMGDSLLVLETVDLRGNKFDCSDCNTTEFQRWLMKTMFKFERLSVVRTNSEDVVCASPKALAGQNILKITVDDDHCTVSETQNYFILVVVPIIAFVFVLALTSSTLAYKYRFELAYIRYYWSIKKRKHTLEVTEDGEYEFDAFVSYSRHDRAWVLDELMVHLEGGLEKYKLCLHERDFRLGSLILENIESSMSKSRYTLVILSRGFVDSQWCRWELEMANYKLFDDRREFLILLELEHLERRLIPRHLKYLIETRTYLEWPTQGTPAQQATFWRRLRRALGKSLHQHRHRPSAADTTITTTTTTTTIVATATTTTVVTTVAGNHSRQEAAHHNTDNNLKAIAPFVFGSVRRVPYNTSIIAVPHSKLIEESEV